MCTMDSSCVFGDQYIISRDFFSLGFKTNLLEKEMFSWIILSFDLLENSYDGLGAPFIPISQRCFEIYKYFYK